MENENRVKQERENKCKKDTAAEDEERGEIWPFSVGPGISGEQHWPLSRPQRDKGVERKEAHEVEDEKFVWLTGWVSDTCL